MAGQNGGISIGVILSGCIELLRRHASLAGLAFGALAAVGTLFDVALGERGGQLAGSIATFFVQYLVAEHLLRAEGLLDESLPGRRYGSVFFASLLTTLGGVGAMILLLLPGFYVLARWSITIPIIIAEGLDATTAMRESWRRTQASVWPIFAIFFIGLAGVLGLGVVMGAATAATAGNTEVLMVSALTNILGAAFTVVASTLAVAIYALLGHSRQQYEDIFA